MLAECSGDSGSGLFLGSGSAQIEARPTAFQQADRAKTRISEAEKVDDPRRGKFERRRANAVCKMRGARSERVKLECVR